MTTPETRENEAADTEAVRPARSRIVPLLGAIVLSAGLIWGTSLSSPVTKPEPTPHGEPETLSEVAESTLRPSEEPESSEEPEPTPEPTPEPIPDAEDGVQFDAQEARKIGGALYFGDTAYELYNSSRDASRSYCKTMSKAADKYEGRYRFFTMLCPNSGGIMLAYDVYDQLYHVRQGEAIESFYENRSENLIPVYIYDTLRAHNSEYLYFRSDHHWTALGA